MADYQNQNKRPTNLLRAWQHRLVGDLQPNEKRPPTLGFAVLKNQAVVEVRTNVQNDKDYGRIQAKMDIPTFYIFLGLLDKVTAGPNGVKETMEIRAFRFIKGQRSSEPMLDAKLMVMKDDDGTVSMAALSWDRERPSIKFIFRTNNLASLVHADNTPWGVAEASVMIARQWSVALRHLVAIAAYHEYDPPPPRDPSGAGNSGGNRNSYNNNAGSGGGSTSKNSEYGSNNESSDDSFPFP